MSLFARLGRSTAALALVLAFAGLASAAENSLNFNFSGGSGAGPTSYDGTTATVIGPAGVGQSSVWNNVLGGYSNSVINGPGGAIGAGIDGGDGSGFGGTTQIGNALDGYTYTGNTFVYDHGGTSTAALNTTLAFSGSRGPGSTYSSGLGDNDPSNPNAILVNNFLDTGGMAQTTVTISNIPISGPFEVFVYVARDLSPNNPSETSSYSLNGGTAVSVLTGPVGPAGSAFTLATSNVTGNYIEFTNVTGPNLTLVANSSGQDTSAPIDGIQIFQPVGVPEPASVSLAAMGLGLAGIAAVRRKLRGRQTA